MPDTTSSFTAILADAGLSPDRGPVPPVSPEGFIAQWPAQGILRLTGPDARRFLQGQLTCQIDLLETTQSLLGATCTPKGKALANFRLVALENGDILLRLSADLELSLTSHFQKYLAFFKAQLESAQDWCLLGLTGARILALLGLEGSPEPGQVRQWRQSLSVASQPDAHGLPRVELWLNRADIGHLQQCLQRTPKEMLAPQAAWLAGEIQGGLTVIDGPLQDRYVPQFFNWHAVDGISFRKGCYTGQEIIARMRYLGQLKKSTYRVLLPEGGASALSVVTDSAGLAAGEITNLVSYTDGRQEALAVLKHTATSSELQLADAPQHPVLIGSLPYSMPEQDVPSER